MLKSAVKFSSVDQELIDSVRSALPAACIMVEYAGCDYGLIGSKHGHNSLLTMLRHLGLAGKKADQKFIPTDYMESSYADRLELLRGLMDTDGELDWSPGIHQQCIWRLDREGQTNPVTAFFLVTDDGSDPPMMDVLGIKASEAQSIVDPHLGVEVKENDISHLRRLVERYLDKKASGIAAAATA